MIIDTVLLDCSGSMGMSSGDSTSLPRMDFAFSYLKHLYDSGNIMDNTVIIAFENLVRGGITYSLLHDRFNPIRFDSLDPFLQELFTPEGGTNILSALNFAQDGNILLLTDMDEKYIKEALNQNHIHGKNQVVTVIMEYDSSARDLGYPQGQLRLRNL